MMYVTDFPLLGMFAGLITVYINFAIARALLQYSKADFYNPVSRFIDRITVVPIRILRMFVPRVGGSDLLSPAILVLICAAVEQYLKHDILNPLVLSVLAIARTIDVGTDFVTFVILAHAVLSWVAPRKTFTVAKLINSVSYMLLAPFRRFIPPVGNIDFTPLVALIAISVVAGTVHNALIRLIT